VRPARRPAGWVAPGPRPSSASGAHPGPGEDLCWLAGDWRVLQRTDGHRFSLDDLVTAAFAARMMAVPPARLLDLGCGIGSVLMFLAWRFPAAACVGIEAQALSAELARRSIAHNGAAARCEVRLGDLRDPAREGHAVRVQLAHVEADAESPEDPLLDVGAVDSDRSAAELGAVQHDVVRPGPHARGIGLEEVEVLLFEPAGVRNTGSVEDPILTAPQAARL